MYRLNSYFRRYASSSSSKEMIDRCAPRVDLLKTEEEITKRLVDKGYNKMIWPRVKYIQMKGILKFFREGLMNLWRVHRELGGKFYSGDKFYWENFNKVPVRRADFKKVVDILAGRVSLIEASNSSRGGSGSKEQILISGREFDEMGSDFKEFKKLPLFGILFLVLEELSFAVVYVFPWLLPKTCVLPGIIEKRYYRQRAKAVAELGRLKNLRTEREVLQYVAAVMALETRSLLPVVYSAQPEFATQRRLAAAVVGCRAADFLFECQKARVRRHLQTAGSRRPIDAGQRLTIGERE